jgi:hypothetical protein
MGRKVMQESNDVRKFVNGAEQAEARGDHVAAERLLRRALVLQEFGLGPQHPEVANTLNNLAILCEMNGKLSDAETCYRRAYAIAITSLPAGDPFVTTSRENLEQFCAARGVKLGQLAQPAASSPAATPPSAGPRASAPAPKPSAPPKMTAPPRAAPPRATPPRATPPRGASPALPSPPRTPPSAPARVSSAVPVNPRAFTTPATRRSSRVSAYAVALAAVALVGAGWYWFESNAALGEPEVVAPVSSVAPPPAPSPAPPEPASAVDPTAPSAPPAPAPEPAAEPAPVTPSPSPVAAAPEPPAPSPATTRAASINVVTAQLCRTLTRTGVWTCAPVTGMQASGTMYYYTRVASPRDTTIEHRWYRDDRLQQRVPLKIRANPSGFRTYSQTRVNADRSGSWKVELRSQDGQILHEETFGVK